ncbi:MAG: hypothetical protein A2Z88_01650 [Omnitrophica WOR_2 bacterium GWA2_47_8]|nr:MAG: hypothetical protein A2Z88_01650 [Omnitrophica WOR_2 bacterium GWA2_47_8]
MQEKDNKIFVIGIIVIVGVFLGINLMQKENSSPLMREMMKQQSETLSALKNLEKSVGGEEGQGGSATQDLQKRVAVLEAKMDMVLSGGPGQRPQPAAPAAPEEDYSKVYDIPIDHSPVRGKKDAEITIVEFVDFQCPFCARFHNVSNDVLGAYPNDARYILKNFPLSFHPEAKPAAKAAFAAGEQGKYWEMVDAILEDNSNLSADRYKELAKKIGLNVDKFEKDLQEKDSQYEDWITKDMELGSQVAVQGTPTFYLNGQKTVARSLPQYKTVIDGILKK